MTVIKKIVNALALLCKAGKSVLLSERTETVVAAGEKFMCITLMAYVKYKSVLRTVENPVEGNCKLYDSDRKSVV